MKIKAFFICTVAIIALTVILTLNNSLSYATVEGSDPTPTPVSTDSPIRVEEIKQIGRGGLYQLIWSSNDALFAMSSTGIWKYSTDDFVQEPTLVTNQLMLPIVISPDNMLFAGELGSINILDVSSGETKATLVAPPDQNMIIESASTLVFSPDQSELMVAYDNGMVFRWDIETSQLETNFQVSAAQQMSFSNDGGKLAIATEDNHVQIWDTQTGSMSFDVPIGQWVLNTEFNPKGNLLAVSTYQYIVLIDTLTGTEVAQFGKEGGEELLFSPDGQMLASATIYGTVTVWNLETNQEKQTLNGGYGVAFSPDSQHLASGSRDGYIRIWNLETGIEETTLGIYLWEVHGLAFSPDSERLFFSFADVFVDSDYLDLRVLNVETGEIDNVIQEYGSAVLTTLSISADGSLLALATQRGDIQLIDVKTLQRLGTIEWVHSSDIRSLSFSADSSVLMSLSSNIDRSAEENLKIWDIQSPSAPELLDGWNYEASDAVFSPTPMLLVLSTPEGLMLWDLASEAEPHRLESDLETENSALCPSGQFTFSPDGSLLILYDCNGHTQIWDARNWEFLKELSPVGSSGIVALEISPDNKTLLIGNNLWDIENDLRITSLVDIDGIKFAAFSKDGQYLATGSYTGTVRLWKVVH